MVTMATPADWQWATFRVWRLGSSLRLVKLSTYSAETNTNCSLIKRRYHIMQVHMYKIAHKVYNVSPHEPILIPTCTCTGNPCIRLLRHTYIHIYMPVHVNIQTGRDMILIEN